PVWTSQHEMPPTHPADDNVDETQLIADSTNTDNEYAWTEFITPDNIGAEIDTADNAEAPIVVPTYTDQDSEESREHQVTTVQSPDEENVKVGDQDQMIPPPIMTPEPVALHSVPQFIAPDNTSSQNEDIAEI